MTKPTDSKNRIFDPLRDEHKPEKSPSSATTKTPSFRVWTLGQLKKEDEPEGWNLVGDYHLTRGAITVLAGSPGIGKSFATLMLGIAGARGNGDWLNYKINRRFKTLIIQAENNLLRLTMDAKRVEIPVEHDDMLKILEFDWGNISLQDGKLMSELHELMQSFQPDLVVIDPFNQFSGDSNEKECKEAVRGIISILEAAEERPACMIVAHNRKKREGDNHSGRRLADLISGSYVMQSNPRCVISYLPFTDDPSDNRVVVMTVKKNNGKEKGPPTAWCMEEDGYYPIEDFDYAEWAGGSAGEKVDRSKIKEHHIVEAFKDGPLTRKTLGEKLAELAGAGRSAISEAIKHRFAHMIVDLPDGVFLRLHPDYGDCG